MTRELVLITGGGSGIGAALAKHYVSEAFDVVIVGRTRASLEAIAETAPNNITYVVADVSTPEARRKIVSGVPKGRKLKAVIHNAALLKPVVPLSDMILSDFRYHMAVNVEGPLFLTQALLPKLESGSRILHISSGAAHKAYKGWGAYCTSKAALNMLYRSLDLELKDQGIRVGSVRPGVVDTPMQGQVRESSKDAFPDLPRFEALKKDGALEKPETVAKFLFWLLNTVEAEAFAAEEWEIRDEEQHKNAWR